MKWIKDETIGDRHELLSDCGFYKLVRYGGHSYITPCCQRLGVKYCWSAYKPVSSSGQFGNHVEPDTEYYKTKREAINACKRHKEKKGKT